MALYSSSECNKLLRSLKEEYENVLSDERDKKSYTYGTGEEPEIPEYDFLTTNRQLRELEDKIATIKHAVSIFNTTYVLPELGFTIDVALYRMAVLNNTKSRLYGMKRVQEKVRRLGYSGVTEYTIRNYNADDVEKAYKEVEKLINDIQLGIDYANITEKFEVSL